jgi:hypothetical protein
LARSFKPVSTSASRPRSWAIVGKIGLLETLNKFVMRD